MQDKNIIKSKTMYIIYLGVITRILLFVKDMLTASKIGANYNMDSYVIALSAIMLLTKIVGEGLVVAIIPVLQEIQERHGGERRLRYTNNLINIVGLLSLIIMIIGYLFAPMIIRLFAPGFKALELEKTVLLFRIGLPIMALSWIRSIGGGVLQSDHAFRAGAKGGISSAVVYIVFLLFFVDRFQLTGLMAVGILAVLSQIYIIFKTMAKAGYRYEWVFNLEDRYLRKVVMFLFPIILGVGINELNNSIDNAIASTLSSGSVAELNYANDIINLLLGLFVTAIVTVMFPMLSERNNKNDLKGFREGVNHGICTLVKFAVPISIIFSTMAEPIVKIFFERGAFDAEASFLTAAALAYYSLGFTSMTLIPFMIRIYYSIHDMKTPLKIAVFALLVNIFIDLTLAPIIGAKGIALGTSISVIISTIIGFIDLNRKIKFISGKGVKLLVVKLSVSGVIMFVGIMLTYGAGATYFGKGFIYNIITVGFSALVGYLLYLLMWKVLEPVKSI